MRLIRLDEDVLEADEENDVVIVKEDRVAGREADGVDRREADEGEEVRLPLEEGKLSIIRRSNEKGVTDETVDRSPQNGVCGIIFRNGGRRVT